MRPRPDAPIGLIGASGFTGALTAAALDRRGVAFVVAGRDADRIGGAVAGLGNVAGTRVVDVDDRGALGALCSEVAVLITTVGPFDRLGRPVLEAAVAAGCGYLDSTGEQTFMRWAFDHVGPAATSADVTAIPACGFDYVPGDLLASAAAAHVATPDEVHVAYLVRGTGLPLGWMSRGTRSTLATGLGQPGLALVDQTLEEEPLGAVRRVAWFPRPVGPRHAAGYAGGEPLTVPRHLPTARTVRSYLALPAVVAEAAQAGANASRWGPLRALTSKLLDRGPEGPSPQRRAATKWACVAEVIGADGEVARAWASGTDVYGFTAEVLAAGAHRLTTDGGPAGVVAPAEAFAPSELLDELADVTDLRWSARAPGS